VAKYDWIALEKEYILSDYKSVSAFLKEKGINNNGTTRKHTSGWKDKKRQKEVKKATKTIEKVVEKQSTEDAKTNIKINDVANKLLEKIMDTVNDINTTDSIKKLTSALNIGSVILNWVALITVIVVFNNQPDVSIDIIKAIIKANKLIITFTNPRLYPINIHTNTIIIIKKSITILIFSFQH